MEGDNSDDEALVGEVMAALKVAATGSAPGRAKSSQVAAPSVSGSAAAARDADDDGDAPLVGEVMATIQGAA
eukprot:CAMPEP_0118927792 /NCGR_PEP_ID=MMETSP1169-20130426/5196_1 /TAXON_ID=36882 /ORGANISM="Pyramimonas obovata, Strain CCMP722" /LENGTH=71 /DNA_ID=CAMNT_0006869635 /DNA_START=173 /DNA_END=385 /DNA_ORIENTATION=+